MPVWPFADRVPDFDSDGRTGDYSRLSFAILRDCLSVDETDYGGRRLFLGLTFNFGALIGWAAVTENVGTPAIILYIAGFFWTLGYDTIYAHQDIEDDMQVGIKSTALRLGADSRKWIMKFYIAAWLLIMLALLSAHASGTSMLVLALAGAHLAWQLMRWNPDSPKSSLRKGVQIQP